MIYMNFMFTTGRKNDVYLLVGLDNYVSAWYWNGRDGRIWMNIIPFIILGWGIGMVIMVLTIPKFTAWLHWRDLEPGIITWEDYWKRIKEITSENKQ